MTTILFDFCKGDCKKLLIISNHENSSNNKKFTIQYSKEQLDKIQSDFLQQLSKYFAKVNNNNNRIEVEIVPPTAIIIEEEQEEVLK